MIDLLRCEWRRSRHVPGTALIAGVLSVVIASTPTAEQSATRQRLGALTGVIRDAVTGQPVAGATVSLRDLDDRENLPARQVTDGLGRFVFVDLKPSDGYFIDSRAFGYASTRYGWTKPGQSPAINDIARVHVAAGQWVRNIEVPLWRLGVIEGRVTDESGEPIVGTAVRVFSVRGLAGRSQLVAGPLAVTDDRGAYRFSGLDPDRYLVAVLSVQSTVLVSTPEEPMLRPMGELATGGIGAGRGRAIRALTVDVTERHRLALTNFAPPPPPGGGPARAYATQFYPSADLASAAEPIEVGYGDRRTAIDLQLRPVRTTTVSGRVTAPSGVDPPPFLLRLLPQGHEQLGFGGEAATTILEPDGAFTFLNVPTGAYTLLAQSSVMDFTTGSASVRFDDLPGFPGGGIGVGSAPGAPGLSYLRRSGQTAAVWGRASVSVGIAPVTGLVVDLRPTVTVHGRIEYVDGSEPADRVSIRAEPASGDPSFSAPSTAARRADDGSMPFELAGLLGGRYLINPGRNVVSVMHGGRDITFSGLDVSAGADVHDLVVTLTTKEVAVSGVVHARPDDLTVAVIAFPTDRSRWRDYGWAAVGFDTTRSGTDGSYTLASLPAGEYFLVAVAADRIDDWVDPAFLEAAAPHATRVAVDWGESVRADLTYTIVRDR